MSQPVVGKLSRSVIVFRLKGALCCARLWGYWTDCLRFSFCVFSLFLRSCMLTSTSCQFEKEIWCLEFYTEWMCTHTYVHMCVLTHICWRSSQNLINVRVCANGDERKPKKRADHVILVKTVLIITKSLLFLPLLLFPLLFLILSAYSVKVFFFFLWALFTLSLAHQQLINMQSQSECKEIDGNRAKEIRGVWNQIWSKQDMRQPEVNRKSKREMHCWVTM